MCSIRRCEGAEFGFGVQVPDHTVQEREGHAATIECLDFAVTLNFEVIGRADSVAVRSRAGAPFDGPRGPCGDQGPHGDTPALADTSNVVDANYCERPTSAHRSPLAGPGARPARGEAGQRAMLPWNPLCLRRAMGASDTRCALERYYGRLGIRVRLKECFVRGLG